MKKIIATAVAALAMTFAVVAPAAQADAQGDLQASTKTVCVFCWSGANH